MRPLIVILAAASAARAKSGLDLAAASAALGAATRLHIDASAIGLLGDAGMIAAIEQVCSLGAVLSLCPTGLADAGLTPLPFPDADRCGLLSLLGEAGDDARLLVI